MPVCVLCRAECPTAAAAAGGGVCSGCGGELCAWLQWRARSRRAQHHFSSSPRTAHRTLRVLLTRLPPPDPQTQHQPAHTDVPRSEEKKRGVHRNSANWKQPPPCPKCGTLFISRGGLKCHLFYVHKIPRSECHSLLPTITCDICNKIFKKEYKLFVHNLMHHAEEQCKPFPCDKCEKRFPSLSQLKQHRICHFDPTFCCTLCNRKYHHKNSLQNHVVNNHLSAANTYICPLCGKVLKSAQNLKAHKQNVHGDRKFECCKCGLILKSRDNLRNHQKYIHGPRDEIFHCSLCDYTAHFKHYLRAHVRYAHSSTVGHQCSTCKKWYASKTYLKQHQATCTS